MLARLKASDGWLVLWFVALMFFLTTPMPETWFGRSANLFGTMFCAGVFGIELRVALDRFRR